MTSCEMHLKQYKHNLDFAKNGIKKHDNDEFLDWQITAYFYTIVHLIEYVLVKNCGGGSEDHGDRYNLMTSNKSIFDREKVLNKYTALKALAQTSRYTGGVYVDSGDVYRAFGYMEDLQSELEIYVEKTKI